MRPTRGSSRPSGARHSTFSPAGVAQASASRSAAANARARLSAEALPQVLADALDRTARLGEHPEGVPHVDHLGPDLELDVDLRRAELLGDAGGVVEQRLGRAHL